MKKIILAAAILLLSTAAFAANSANQKAEAGVERYAIYIGSNYGGKEREKLLYAGSDAQNFQKTMAEIGGVPEKNSWLLIDPTKETVEEAIESVSATIEKKNNLAKRSEFLFYYSGHSTEDELLLGDDKYDYSSLKKAITEVPSDIHVVILDSCYSGNFIRTKGGQKKKPFLMDDSSVVKGHAYLSSSSEKESSQESDEIESSYFTNAMITGLRGAADTSGDNKVSLTELYSYAFNDTLSKTEETDAGPQHPNYNITLVGSGDLILSDISTAEASVVIAKEAEGRFIIRDARGKLISEINKSKGIPITMALSAGTYTVVVITDTSTKQGTFILNVDDTFLIEESGMQKVTRKETKQRGGKKIPNAPVTEGPVVEEEYLEAPDDYEEEYVAEENEEFLSFTPPSESSEPEEIAVPVEKEEEETDEDSILKFSYSKKTEESEDGGEPKEKSSFNLSIKIPGNDENTSEKIIPKSIIGTTVKNISWAMANDKGFVPFQLSFTTSYDFLAVRKSTTMFAFGIFGTSTKNILGIQTASFSTIAKENLIGVQTAGITATAGNLFGIQTSGITAKADNLCGVQTGGICVSGGKVVGIQTAGISCTADVIYGMQSAGIYNGAKSVYGSQYSGIANHAEKLRGIQWAGISNSADDVRGMQISPIVNYAKTLNGVQIGLINISDEGHGFGIGLFNYIKNGVHDFGYSFDTDKEHIIQYQSGSNTLFTTIGVAYTSKKSVNYDPAFSQKNMTFVGIGSRFNLGDDDSIDFEFLWKISSKNMKGLKNSVKSETGKGLSWSSLLKFNSTAIKATGTFFNIVNNYQIPAARLTVNLGLGKHLTLFASGTFDIKFNGWNDKAFDEGYKRTWEWSNSQFAVYPSISAGIKIR